MYNNPIGSCKILSGILDRILYDLGRTKYDYPIGSCKILSGILDRIL